MKSLAKGIVDSAAFLELSGEDVVDPDCAVRALESIAHCLQHASEAEKLAVLEYCHEQAAGVDDDRRKDFYEHFGDAMGLTHTGDRLQ